MPLWNIVYWAKWKYWDSIRLKILKTTQKSGSFRMICHNVKKSLWFTVNLLSTIVLVTHSVLQKADRPQHLFVYLCFYATFLTRFVVFFLHQKMFHALGNKTSYHHHLRNILLSSPCYLEKFMFFFFFSIGVFFHEHSRSTGQQGKGEGIYLTPLYHFHPLHRHLDISRAITADSSPLCT